MKSKVKYVAHSPQLPGLPTKDLPVSRLKPRWKSCMAVCQKLAKIRKSNVVDICMDRITRQIIVDDFILNSRGFYKSVEGFAPKPCAASLDYITIEHDGVKMNLVHSDWFDKSREAAVKKGWPVRAWAMDFSCCRVKNRTVRWTKKNRHRIILFKP